MIYRRMNRQMSRQLAAEIIQLSDYTMNSDVIGTIGNLEYENE